MKNFILFFIIEIFLNTTSCYEQKIPNLGCGYKLDDYEKYSFAIINSENTQMIPSHIIEYAFDSTFIIASQRPWDVPDIPGINEMTYDQRNEAFEKSMFLQYWIINKIEKNEYSFDSLNHRACYSNVYGPYKKEEYLQKREELGVPKELQLKGVVYPHWRGNWIERK